MTAAAKTATKPAAKTTKPVSAKPAKTTTKATKPAAAAAPVSVAKTPLHYVRDSFRPGSGALLFAYTMAWLQESGLIDGGDISRSDAVKFAGATAIQYHTNNTKRMEDKGGRIKLSATGANFFADRRHSTEDREAFRAMMRTGQPDGKLIKQTAAFGKLDA